MEKNKLSFQLKAEDFLPAGDDEKKKPCSNEGERQLLEGWSAPF